MNRAKAWGAMSIFIGSILAGNASGAENSSNVAHARDGKGAEASFDYPLYLARDRAGNVYVTDFENYTIRKITPDGVVTTLAGVAGKQGHVDGIGSAARFDGPVGIAADSAGNLYVSDHKNAGFMAPMQEGSYYIRKISTSGEVTTIAGGKGGHADGKGAAAGFLYPMGIATDEAGDIYVADTGNHTIRKVTGAGVVTTFAGAAGIAGSADGVGESANFNWPSGIATDRTGNIYVADSHNHVIRKITQEGRVTTLAGTAGKNGNADGTGAAARFSYPKSVDTDSTGNIFVVDSGNAMIRKITRQGLVTTFFRSHRHEDEKSVYLFSPMGIAVDSAGNVYVADTGHNIIRKITPSGMVTTLAGAIWNRSAGEHPLQ